MKNQIFSWKKKNAERFLSSMFGQIECLNGTETPKAWRNGDHVPIVLYVIWNCSRMIQISK